MPDAPTTTIQQIDDLLPQTQCRQCGFEGCRPYAEAIAQQQAPINRCPPGGNTTIEALSRLTGQPITPVDPSCGTTTPRHIANIQAEHCIGCTLCIKACPVDAIIGANKHRHAVIASLCTGCELCIAPCPVDCIDMTFIPEHSEWNQTMAHDARHRMHTRTIRLERQQQETAQRLENKALHKHNELNQAAPSDDNHKKQAIIAAAIAKARARRNAQP